MNFNTAILPLMRVSFLLGLAPFALLTTLHGSSIFKRSRSALAYSMFVAAAMFVVENILIPCLTRGADRHPAMWVIDFTRILQGASRTVIFVYTHVACFLRQDTMLKILSQMSKLEADLGISSHTYKRCRLVTIGMLCVYLVAILVTYVLYYIGWQYDNSTLPVFVLLVFISLSNSIAEIQFNSSVLMLNALHRAFNKQVASLQNSTDDGGYLVPPNPCKYDKVGPACLTSKLQTTVVPLPGNPRSYVSNVRQQDDAPFRKLHELIALHGTLYELIHTVNSYFGFQNALLICESFLTLIYCQYYLSFYFADLYTHEDPENSPYIMLGSLVYHSVMQSSRLVFMVKVCSSLTAQAEKLGFIVSKLQSSAKTSEVRQKVRANCCVTMEGFAIQLIPRKVQFNACNLFPIDATLLTSIVGGVTTYLVILIQFQSTSLPQNANKNTTNN